MLLFQYAVIKSKLMSQEIKESYNVANVKAQKFVD